MTNGHKTASLQSNRYLNTKRNVRKVLKPFGRFLLAVAEAPCLKSAAKNNKTLIFEEKMRASWQRRMISQADVEVFQILCYYFSKKCNLSAANGAYQGEGLTK